MADPRGVFAGAPSTVAHRLLGATLTRTAAAGVVAVRLTEVEAYAGAADPASHAFRGRTARNAVMFGPGGHAYVYFTYGMHHCINVVCGPAGESGAVLLRAGEVVHGLALARARRPTARTDRELARGPARLTVALDIDRSLDGTDLLDPGAPVTLALGVPVPDALVAAGPRVGVSAAREVPWRLWLRDDPTVSVYRPAVVRRRSGRPSTGG